MKLAPIILSFILCAASAAYADPILSGDLITDAVRNASIEGDGAVADGSIGIWPVVTNDLSNANFSSGTTSWTVSQGTGTTSSSEIKFGTQSLKLTAGGGGVLAVLEDATPATAGARSASVWVYATAGAVDLFAQLQIYERGGVNGQAAVCSYSDPTYGTSGKKLVAGWNYLSCSGTVAYSDDTAIRFQVNLSGPGAPPAATVIYVSGPMLARFSAILPYAVTTRTAGRIQLPVISSITTTRGWVAVRIRPSWASGSPPSSTVNLWRWADDATHAMELVYESGAFILRRITPGGTETASYTSFFTANMEITVVGRWSASRVSVSVNAQAFYNSTSEEFSDDFERADTASGLGTATTGQTWEDQGSGTPRIVSGRYQQADEAVYPDAPLKLYERIDLTLQPAIRSALASFVGTTGPHAAVAIISTNDPTTVPPNTYSNMLHIVVGAEAWTVDVYDNRTGTTMLGGNYTDLPGVTILKDGYYNLLIDGTVYTITLNVDIATSSLRLQITQGATSVLDRTLVDSRIATHHGKYLCWQTYRGAEFVATEDVIPRFESVSAQIPVDVNSGTAQIPTLAATLMDIGSAGGSGYLYGDIIWYSTGSGSISAALGNIERVSSMGHLGKTTKMW